MGKGKERTPELTVGLDLGDRYCEICALDPQGKVVERGCLGSAGTGVSGVVEM